MASSFASSHVGHVGHFGHFGRTRVLATLALGPALACVACGPSTFRLRPASEESTPVVAQPVTVSRRVPQAGAVTRTTEIVSVALRLTVRSPGKPTRAADMLTTYRVAKEETALAVKGGVTTALRVSYSEAFADERLVLGGPTSVSATRADATIEGTGTTRIESSWQYLKPKDAGT